MRREELIYIGNSMAVNLECLRGRGQGDSKIQQDTESTLRKMIPRHLSEGTFFKEESGAQDFYAYTGLRYVPMSKEDYMAAIKYALDKIEVGVVYQMNSTNKMYNDAMTTTDFHKYTPTKGVVSFKNKVLDLDTMEVYDHDGKIIASIYLDFEYDPKAKCPTWEKFLTESLPDKPSQLVLQEFMGNIFIDRKVVKKPKSLFLFGEGANGKSVINDVMEAMLGDNMSKTSIHNLCADMHSEYYLAQVDGKLLNFAADEDNETFSTGRFKALVESETMTVRRPAGEPYEAKNLPLLAACLNKMPPTTDTSNGFYRRLIIIPFYRVFREEEQDPLLVSKLVAEMSGIFNWVLEGRSRFIRQNYNYTYSKNVEDSINKLRKDSDNVMLFLEDNNFVPVGGDTRHRYSMDEFYGMYKTWCPDNGFKQKSIKTFKETLKRLGYRVARMRYDSDRCGNPVVGAEVWEILNTDTEEVEEVETNNKEEEDFPF